MDIQNQRAFESRLALKGYRKASGLMAAEKPILAALEPRIRGKATLDIGVGGGRTTPFLTSLTEDYSAIDYSEGLVQQVRKKYKLNTIYRCDVQDMSRFPDSRFDFGFFSFNGLDCISHEGRLKALGEIRRILKPGGIFLFSSHNRNYLEATHGTATGKDGYTGLQALKRRVWKLLLTPRHLRLRRYEKDTAEYAIVNDSGLRYSLLLYYIGIRAQIEQLERNGFQVDGVYDGAGQPALDDDQSPWIHYLAHTVPV
jgi:ubiquinone/menaquinone biosynthesis C-methylase UbiE